MTDEKAWAAKTVREMVELGIIDGDHATRNRTFWTLVEALDSDRDATRSAAAKTPVPQDLQARAESIAPNQSEPSYE